MKDMPDAAAVMPPQPRDYHGVNWAGLRTLYIREIRRFWKVGMQTLAAPVVTALLITNIALGILTRAAPQLNLFAIGFPVTLTVGFGVLLLALGHLAPVLQGLYDLGFHTMANLVRALR